MEDDDDDAALHIRCKGAVSRGTHSDTDVLAASRRWWCAPPLKKEVMMVAAEESGSGGAGCRRQGCELLSAEQRTDESPAKPSRTRGSIR